ncbi:MAG: HAD family hydrolase [Gaiellaceae bacterium]
MARAALLDVDGTLVDASYQQVLAWYRAFRKHDVVLGLRHLHRHIGMGGDIYVPAVAGETVERQIGDDVRDEWEKQFERMIAEVAPFASAHDFVAALKERGHTVVLASSSIAKHAEHFLDLLGVRDLVDDWTTKDDVDATKPEPDLVKAAIAKAGTEDAVMVGDTPWDIEAARKAGLDTIAVLTGGAYSAAELRDAGAIAVFESVGEMKDRLAETPLS